MYFINGNQSYFKFSFLVCRSIDIVASKIYGRKFSTQHAYSCTLIKLKRIFLKILNSCNLEIFKFITMVYTLKLLYKKC